MINKNRKREQKKWQSLAPVMSFHGMRVILICCLPIFASSVILFVLLFVLRKDAKEHEVSAEFLVGSLAVTGRWGLISPTRTDNSGWMTKPKGYIFSCVHFCQLVRQCEFISAAGSVATGVQATAEAQGSGQGIQLPGRDGCQGAGVCQELLCAGGKRLMKMCTWRTVFFWEAISAWSVLDTFIDCGVACFVCSLFQYEKQGTSKEITQRHMQS